MIHARHPWNTDVFSQDTSTSRPSRQTTPGSPFLLTPPLSTSALGRAPFPCTFSECCTRRTRHSRSSCRIALSISKRERSTGRSTFRTLSGRRESSSSHTTSSRRTLGQDLTLCIGSASSCMTGPTGRLRGIPSPRRWLIEHHPAIALRSFALFVKYVILRPEVSDFSNVACCHCTYRVPHSPYM